MKITLQQMKNEFYRILIKHGFGESDAGERVLRTRYKNMEEGIPVEDHVWEEILQL